MGPPKTEAAEHTIPMTPMVVNVLKEWRLQSPRKDGALELVFPNSAGKPQDHARKQVTVPVVGHLHRAVAGRSCVPRSGRERAARVTGKGNGIAQYCG
jgi:hypothetical protein